MLASTLIAGQQLQLQVEYDQPFYKVDYAEKQ